MRNGPCTLGVPSLVPSAWELVRRGQNGSEEVVARNVASFDIGSDGTLVYSNGRGIFTLANPRKPKLVLKDNFIEDVVVG